MSSRGPAKKNKGSQETAASVRQQIRQACRAAGNVYLMHLVGYSVEYDQKRNYNQDFSRKPATFSGPRAQVEDTQNPEYNRVQNLIRTPKQLNISKFRLRGKPKNGQHPEACQEAIET